MDKASRAIRRSGAKILSLGNGVNSDLNVMISELKDLRTSTKTFITAQESASQDMKRWAANEENRAIQDVAYHIAELNIEWTQVQKDFADHLKEYRQMFELVLEGEKQVAQAKMEHSNCEQKEEKLRKDLKKARKREAKEEAYAIEGKLEQVQSERETTAWEATEVIRENEAVKMIRLKEGFVRMAEAYIELGKKCATIFQAQKDVALEIPDVHGLELEEVKYSGTVNTQTYVKKAKEKLDKYRRESYRLEKPKMQTVTFKNDPPPPYSSSEVYHRTDRKSTGDTQEFHHSHSDSDIINNSLSPSYSDKSPNHHTSPGYHGISPCHRVHSPGYTTINGHTNTPLGYHTTPPGCAVSNGHNSVQDGYHTTSPSYATANGYYSGPVNQSTISPGYTTEGNYNDMSKGYHTPSPSYNTVNGYHGRHPGHSATTPELSPHKHSVSPGCQGSTPGYTTASPGYKSIYPTLPKGDDEDLCKELKDTKIY